MGLLRSIFGGKQTTKNDKASTTTAVVARDEALQVNGKFLDIHPDIREYLWIGDGKYKNYIPTPPKKVTISELGISLSVSFGSDEEPSLIFMGLPIAHADGPVERPPYYPTCKE